MTLIVTGSGSKIVEELARLVPEERIRRIGAGEGRLDLSQAGLKITDNMIPEGDRFLLAAGLLQSVPINLQLGNEIVNSITVNLISHVKLCEWILTHRPTARICLVGSMSAIQGSFDETYALSKAALHAYVQFRKVSSASQQLFCVAPGLISDAGMTRRRHDYPKVLQDRSSVTSAHVAKVIKRLLYDRQPKECTGIVVRVEGERC